MLPQRDYLLRKRDQQALLRCIRDAIAQAEPSRPFTPVLLTLTEPSTTAPSRNKRPDPLASRSESPFKVGTVHVFYRSKVHQFDPIEFFSRKFKIPVSEIV